MTDQQQDRPGCLWFLGGAVIGAVVYLVFRGRLALGILLLLIWLALMAAKGPHHGANAALAGAAFFVWLALRVRRFILRYRDERSPGSDNFYEG